MLGPKIIDTPLDCPTCTQRAATEGKTGIRRTPSSSRSWDVIVDGRYVETFRGLGAQSKAHRAAGNLVILP